MKSILDLNSTMNTARTERVSWKSVGLTYLFYLVLMLLMQWGLSPFVKKGNLLVLLMVCAVVVILLLLFVFFYLKRSPASLGMTKKKLALRYGSGWLFSLGCLLLVFLVNLVAGGLAISINQDVNLLLLGLTLVGFIFQGFLEEFLLRSLLMTQFALKLGVVLAIILNSVIFGLGHMTNAGASVISVVNTILIGLVMSMMFYYHDTIWFVSGFHSGWNFILGPILGIPVSGFQLPTSLFTSRVKESHSFLTGGSYGFEAGFVVTVLAIGLIGFYLYLLKKNRASWLSLPARRQ
ncbi:CPBP family intramembrane glutamic endopeptidase [Streptococcus oriscaviae]|uniref:CPBP family intramembrane metalloprotease n=1 Tax=Streptococcus oriscaviae TaxID=2781599 RepID=A0ABX7YIU5_9STRE|nr:CPBP family intramembrane glutamic endopeptidase [Streptococcus oriscaviae]QUE53731.1 CPBP family intramembrane metalloprotease [Streptococcus oriscaviae]